VQKLDESREKRLTRIKRLDDASFTAEVEKKRNYSVVLEFSTTWCGHCRHAEILLADYAALQASLKHEVVVAKIDAEDFSKIAMTYNATANFPIIAIFPPLKDDPTRPGAKLPHKKYQDARFIRDMSDFFQGADKQLTVTDAQHRSFEVDRDREDSFLIDTLTRKPGQAKKMKKKNARAANGAADDDLTASYDSDGEDAYGDGTGPRAVNTDGSLRRKDGARKQEGLPTMTGPDGETIEMPGADGVFQGFPETVQTLTEDSFRKIIDGSSVALVLHYATPGDEVIMTTYGVVADALGPAMKRGMLKLGALESGNAPSVVPFVGKAPTLTLFRGFAVPSQVRFNTAAGTPLGDGGRLENETEVMAFVERHLNHSRVTSLEISDNQFDKAVSNASLTFAVFFYAPYCDECRPAAQAYDEVAQMLGHRTDIILTRIDISRQPRSYRMLGSPTLPTIAVYDGIPLDGSASIADRRPRFFDGTTRDRPSIHRFLTREGAGTDDAIDNIAAADDDDIITDEDRAGETDAAERARLRELAVEDREMRRKMELVTSSKPLIPLMIPTEGHLNLTLHDFPKGVLVFLTANWCPHCNGHLRTYASVVPAMQDLMAVASFDVSSAPGVLARFGVVSVPSYIFVSQSTGAHHVYGGRQKTAAAITKWALKFAPAKPDPELPLYSEVPDDYDWGVGAGGADTDGDKAAKAKEEAKMFPATIIGSESAARRALEAAAADDRSDKRKSVSATVLFVRAETCDTPRCAALVDNANRVASGLRHSEMIVGIVNVSFGSEFFSALGATSLPAVHIRCGKYAVTKAVSSLAAPMKMSHGALKAKNRVAPDLNLIERVSSLVDANCLTRQALSVEDLSHARRALDADSMKEDAKLTLRHLPRQRAKESSVVFIRPRVCADRCDAYEAVWGSVLKAARKRTAGAEGAVDYVRVDLNEQGNKVLRKVLFQRRIEAPAFVYMPMDLTADPAAVVDGEPSVELAMDVVDSLGRFVGELSADGVVDFIQRRHRKEHG
jgi:thioredoxin-like negative regulator of GroEL